jgi:hypothetical protein
VSARAAARLGLAAALLALGAGLLGPGCGAEPPQPPAPEAESAAPAPATPPLSLRASVVIEPPRIEIGDLFDVEVAVVTPPGHHVPPAPVPKAIPGITVVAAERPDVVREAERWVHRQRFRARARATGQFVWPALELTVEAPDGALTRVPAAERPFEVASLLAEQPERREPFSLRSARLPEAPGAGPWLPALLGSVFTLAALALAGWVRRLRAPAPGETAPAPPLDARAEAARLALAAFERARARGGEPAAAADLASVALRRWAAERFRHPALCAASTEELASRPAPFLLGGRHAALVALLQELDALRFPPAGPGAAGALAGALDRARDFVRDASGPPR